MSPAPKLAPSVAEEHALDAADRLFYQRGIGAVTMAEVRDESGVSLRRLYSLFPSKADLVAAWLEHRHHIWMAGFSAAVDEALAAGARPVDAVFDALERWMTETGFRGCGFINTHAETSQLTDDHRCIIRHHKAALADYFDSFVPGGRALAVVVDGAIVQASIFASAEPIDRARAAARALAAEVSR